MIGLLKGRWLLPLVLLVVANLVVLLGVAWNRTGELEAVIEFTERELELPGAWYSRQEDSGLTLALRWQHDGTGSADFDRDKLRQLGFDVDDVPKNEGPRTAFRRERRPFLVVLEMDGDLWRESIEKRRREEPEEWQSPEDHARRLRRAEVEETRLQVADAGSDLKDLRQRYPDRSRFLIVPGIVGMHWNFQPEPSISGYVSQLLVDSVHVPRSLRAELDRLRAQDGVATPSNTLQPPRYRATVAFGRRLEPILRKVEVIEAEPVPAALE